MTQPLRLLVKRLKNKIMKKILCTVITLVCAMTAFAQSARQIVSKMNEYLKISNTQGMYCTLYHVIPRAENPGSHNIYLLNNKYGQAAENNRVICDGQTQWDYLPLENEIDIEKYQDSNITPEKVIVDEVVNIFDNYRFRIADETADNWIIRCIRKNKKNGKPYLKELLLVIEKDTYYPLGVIQKTDFLVYSNEGDYMGKLMYAISDFGFGVSEQQVSFDLTDYPGVAINDRR